MARDRSRVVCHACHARKVKCDLVLHLKQDGICTNCRKRAETCIRREFRKAQRNGDSARMLPPASILNDGYGITSEPGTISDLSRPTLSDRRSESVTTDTPSSQPGFLGELSVMSSESPLVSESAMGLGSYSRSVNDQILLATGAASLPPRPMIEALSEAYFHYLSHRTPVVDRSDIWTEQPSTLLMQSICMAGSMLRHPKTVTSLAETEQLYVKAKTLFHVNYEPDKLTCLKAICLIGLWNVTPPSIVTIDCTWSWMGLATRLALQMGLHQESTYLRTASPGPARRVAWYLFVQDKLLAATFGRPEMLKAPDFDIRPLDISDFETDNRQAHIFIGYTQLALILGRMLPGQHRETPVGPQEVLSILECLKDWVRDVPPELHLYDASQLTRAYRRDVYELYLVYFTCIIVCFHVCGQVFRPSTTSRISLVASSCMIRLYQEMDFRDDINYLLAINNWYLMVTSVPQLNYNIGAHENDAICNEEIDLLLSILEQRTIKFPGVNAIIETIKRFRSQGSFRTPQGAINTANGGIEYISIPAVQQLFPFPKSMCPRMDLLDVGAGDEPEPFEDGPASHPIIGFEDWTYDLGDFSFLADPF